jgi:small subunit ribosomal protein S16
MATVIRLKRVGAKKESSFRIVVADSRAPRDGRYVEQLGFYNPRPKDAEFRVDLERAAYWLDVGARPSDQVRSLFRKAGVRLPATPTRSRKTRGTKRAMSAKPAAKGPKGAAKSEARGPSPRERARRERKRAARAVRKAARAKLAARAKEAAKAEPAA